MVKIKILTTTATSIDGWIVDFFNSGFNGAIPTLVGNLLLIILCIVLSACACGAIGMEREKNGHPAGLRTHLLIGLGSSLIMILSLYAVSESLPGFNGTRDPMRLAAAGVTGIGFLGAGSIIKDGINVKGLTSAASIWMTMAVGMAFGAGYLVVGTVFTILSLAVLVWLGKLEVKSSETRGTILVVSEVDKPVLGIINKVTSKNNVAISNLDTTIVSFKEKEYLRITFKASGRKKGVLKDVVAEISEEGEVYECRILN